MDPIDRAGLERNLAAASWLIDQADVNQDHEHTQFLVGSVVLWLATIDGLLESQPDQPVRDRYMNARSSTSDGQTVVGLTLARDETAHGTALIVTGQGLTFPLFDEGVLDFGGRWVAAEVIAESYQRRRREAPPKRLRAYQEHVAGQQPLTPLWSALEFFKRQIQALPSA